MLEFHPAASREQRLTAAWYDDARIGMGDRFLSDLVDAIELVEQFPEAGGPWLLGMLPDGIRRVRLKRFPYLLVYVTDPRLVAVAIAHERREPGYWLPRLREL
ncbi:MAG: type II toxin-antitoxin system RelE/ParE family toxin [Alphaproteobacteria bacterium]|nr:type II toxin-antitoxin system RelE/ParE family toxin [Alphaproteobacteria bacterium]